MLGQDWKTLLYSDCVRWSSSAIQRSAGSDSDHRVNKQVTEHLNLTSCVSLRMLCFISRPGRCVKDVVSWCGLSPDSQQEPIHSIANNVAESLKQALRPLTRDPWLLSFSAQLSRSAKNLCTTCLKERYESMVWCLGRREHLCVCVYEIFDDFYEDKTVAVCAVCVRYQSLRGECEWLWIW